MRGATRRRQSGKGVAGSFNPRSPCGERRAAREICGVLVCVSIHAPHAGSDFRVADGEGSRWWFQSTLPMRGATTSLQNCLMFQKFQSTLPMRGATKAKSEIFPHLAVSIHAPHAGSDETFGGWISTEDGVSIHAPHAGSDSDEAYIVRYWSSFNPRSPCGERPDHKYIIV